MRKTRPNPSSNPSAFPASGQAQTVRGARPESGARGDDPLTYIHRHDSMRRFTELLALHYERMCTRQAYYRHLATRQAEAQGKQVYWEAKEPPRRHPLEGNAPSLPQPNPRPKKTKS